MKRLSITVETRGTAAAAWIAGSSHDRYEDRYRFLTDDIPLVARQDRGQMVAVFDGIGGYQKGMKAAQTMADCLVRFYREPEAYPPRREALRSLLTATDRDIYAWGRGRSAGGCAGTVAWLRDPENLFLFHAGDTAGVLLRGEKAEPITRTIDLDRPDAPYFGAGPNLEIQVVHQKVESGDRLLLVTDGVTKVFGLRDAAGVVASHEDAREAAEALCRQSLARGTSDDVTVLVWDLGDD